MTKRTLSLAAAGILLLSGSALAVSYKLNLKPYQLDALDLPLPSGMRVVFQEDHSAPTVLVTSVVGVGSTSEPPGKEGMAHLIEHLNFKTKHGGTADNWDKLRQLGVGFFNATTAQDRTNYFFIAPKDSLVPLLQIEAQRVIDPLEGVTEDELKTEREVVRNELRIDLENSSGKAFELADELVYPEGHPYHRAVIGTHETLDNITMADVKEFVKKWYRPDNFTVLVVGDIDRKQATAIISKAFPPSIMLPPGAKPGTKIGALPSPTPRLQGPGDEPPAPVDAKSIHHIKQPVTNPVAVLAWSLPAGFRDTQALMEITAASMQDALVTELYPDDPEVTDSDKINGLGCNAQPQILATTVYCFVDVVDGQDPEKVLNRALDGLSTMWDSDNDIGSDVPIDEENGLTVHVEGMRKAFRAARARYEAQIFRDSASPVAGAMGFGGAIATAEYLHWTGKLDYYTRQIEQISNVSSSKGRELAFKYLKRDRAVRLIIEPYDTKEKKISQVAADTGSSYAGAILKEDGGAIHDYSKITNDQIAALAQAPDVSKVKELTLPSGLKVVLAKHGAAPFVDVGLYVRGGDETTTPPRLPAFAFSTFSADDPAEVAADWYVDRTGDSRLIGVNAPSGNLPAALDLVYSRIKSTTSTWTKLAFERTERRVKKRIKTLESRPEIWADRAIFNLLTPGAPMGELFDWPALEKLTAADYEAYWKNALAPKNAELFVVGDIDLADAEKAVTSIWGKWREKDPGSPQPGYKAYDAAPARQIALIDDQDRTQAQVRLGCHLKGSAKESRAAREVFFSMLNQDLFVSIRKRAGATYGVYSFPLYYGDTTLMLVQGAIVNDKALPGIRTIFDRLAEIKAGKIDPIKLTETKWNLAGETHSRNQSNADMMATLIAMEKNGQDLTALTSYPRQLADVSAKDISGLLEPCVGHEVLTVSGPAKTLKPGLDGLKLPIEMVDWKHGTGSPEVKVEHAER